MRQVLGDSVGVRPPQPPAPQPRPADITGVGVRVFAYGNDDTDGSGVGWNTYYPNPSFDDEPDRRGYPNARWRGRHYLQGDQLCLVVSGLEAPHTPNHILAVGYEVHLNGGTFSDGTSQKTFVLVRFSGVPDPRDVTQCHALRQGGPTTPVGGGEYGVYLLTNAANGLYVGTEASLRGKVCCDFEGGGTGCSAADQVTSRRLLESFSSQAKARQAFCAAIVERRYFPLGIGLKGRWQGTQTWYGLWDSSVNEACQ